MNRRCVLALLALALPLAAGCTRPPAEAYTTASAPATRSEAVGNDARGEACTAQRGATPPAGLPVASAREVFCGGWTQPSARVVQLRGPSDPAQLDALAAGGIWRTWLEQRVTCDTPERTTLAGGVPARVLACKRRLNGWPHIAVVAEGQGGPILADGVAAALPVIERLARGQTATSAAGSREARSPALEIAVRRLSAEAFGAADAGRFEQLMTLGRELNQAENYAAAEEAYRAALAQQQRLLGADNPDTVGAVLGLAVNLSNQGRAQEAEAQFARAALLAPRAADPTVPARLDHYRGLAAQNAGRYDDAIALLQSAERRYVALLPASTLAGSGTDTTGLTDPNAGTALLGLVETRRNLGLALGRVDRAAEGAEMVRDSRRLLRQARLEPGSTMLARSLRSEAVAGPEADSAAQLNAAARRFAIALPGERPEALTLFLAGARAGDARRVDALASFRAGAAILRARRIALPVPLVVPYLDALDAEARANPASAPALRAEMFAAAQLAQRSDTVRFVQQASARLGVAGGDPRVAEAVRRFQDAEQTLRGLFAERDSAGASPALDGRIAEAQATRAEAEAGVAAAAPGYRQLLLSTVEAAPVAAALLPGEALVTMLLGRDYSWVMALRDGQVTAARATLTESEARRLVTRIRAGVVDANGQPGNFDVAAAAALHAALLAPLEASLAGADTLIVVPDGPLLALPFGLLLTGPADPASLGAAPWLIRRHAVVHMPSPQTLLTLRATSAASAAPGAYLGFGDFVPPNAAQLARTFPVDRCAADARLAAGLGRLPGTRIEVELARRLAGGGPQDTRLGAAFTAASLRAPEIGQRRILHLATHALLPGELSCLPEPAIVVSTAPGAADASAAFVPASALLALKLDADLVILSACNTGGPGGAGGGEALSGLARAFFYAGARGLLVTHWAVDDSAAALTVAEALDRQQQGAGTAAALQGAQVLILNEAGKRLPAAFGHPFYWAPFALIGDGRRPAAGTQQLAAAPAPAPPVR